MNIRVNEGKQLMRTNAGLRVVHRSLWMLIQKRSTPFTLRPRPVVLAVVTHAAAHAACRFKTSDIEVTRV